MTIVLSFVFVSCNDDKEKDEPVTLEELGQGEYVDLGLPSGTLWATRNIGAKSPEECGDYFSWGETAPKDHYGWSAYKWCKDGSSKMTKYNASSDNGTVDNKTELDPEDDAAYVNWGPLWRMPSMEQQAELQRYCTWRWTSINGMNGQLVTGPNGVSLFLPVAGGFCYSPASDFNFASLGSNGFYWSRTLDSNNSFRAWEMDMFSGVKGGCSRNSYRCSGSTVRAVRVPQN